MKKRMLKLATFLDNPGEPQPNTRYRDTRELKRLGYNGLVVYKTTGLSGVPRPDAVGTGEMRRGVVYARGGESKTLRFVPDGTQRPYDLDRALNLRAADERRP